MQWDSLLISVTNEYGCVVSINKPQCSFLQDNEVNIIGKLWSVGTHQDDVERVDAAFQKSLAGRPVSTERCVVGDQGRKTTVLTYIFPFMFNDKLGAVTISQPLYETDHVIGAKNLNVSEYVSSMSKELSNMAIGSGLHRLAFLLAEVQREAEQIVAAGAAKVSRLKDTS